MRWTTTVSPARANAISACCGRFVSLPDASCVTWTSSGSLKVREHHFVRRSNEHRLRPRDRCARCNECGGDVLERYAYVVLQSSRSRKRGAVPMLRCGCLTWHGNPVRRDDSRLPRALWNHWAYRLHVRLSPLGPAFLSCHSHFSILIRLKHWR